MRDSVPTTEPLPGIRGYFLGPRGACGRLILSWGIAGGVLWGGVLVGALVVAGAVSPGFQLLVAPALFLLGGLLGLVHAGVLAVVGRPPGVARGRAIGRVVVAGLVSVPLVLPAYVVTAGVSLTAALVTQWNPGLFALVLLAWLVALALCAWAGREGWLAVRRAYARWPESRAGSVIMVLVAVGVTAFFLRNPPELLGSDLRVNGLGAVLLALAVTLWVGLPLVVTALRFVPESILPHASGGEVGP